MILTLANIHSISMGQISEEKNNPHLANEHETCLLFCVKVSADAQAARQLGQFKGKISQTNWLTELILALGKPLLTWCEPNDIVKYISTNENKTLNISTCGVVVRRPVRFVLLLGIHILSEKIKEFKHTILRGTLS